MVSKMEDSPIGRYSANFEGCTCRTAVASERDSSLGMYPMDGHSVEDGLYFGTYMSDSRGVRDRGIVIADV